MTPEWYDLMLALHDKNTKWQELDVLLSLEFKDLVEYSLSKKQREYVGLLIEGYSIEEIRKLFNVTTQTIYRQIYNIRRRLKNGMELRCDNLKEEYYVKKNKKKKSF